MTSKKEMLARPPQGADLLRGAFVEVAYTPEQIEAAIRLDRVLAVSRCAFLDAAAGPGGSATPRLEAAGAKEGGSDVR